MAKKAYIGVNSKARQVKKIYLGVSSKARKVKKAYIGVGGVARPFFSSNLVDYYGLAVTLSAKFINPGTASVGDYALFAGGQDNSNGNANTNLVDAISSSLVKTSAPVLQNARNSIGGGSIGNYAVFAGGWISSESISDRKEVDAYSSSLVKGSAYSLATRRADPSSANAGDYLLFGNGNVNYDEPPIDAYTTSLTRTTVEALSCSGKYNANGATAGSYALFAGADYLSTRTNIVDAYSSNLVKSSAPVLSEARNAIGYSLGSYALYMGGTNASGEICNVTDKYSSSLVRSSGPVFSTYDDTASRLGQGAVANNYLIIPIFSNDSPYNCVAVDVFSPSLVRSSAPTNLPLRLGAVGASTGKYALFTGGYSGTSGYIYSKYAYAYLVN